MALSSPVVSLFTAGRDSKALMVSLAYKDSQQHSQRSHPIESCWISTKHFWMRDKSSMDNSLLPTNYRGVFKDVMEEF